MKLIRNALAASLLAAVSVAACSSQHGQSSIGSSTNGGSTGELTGQGGLGAVGMHLTIAPGVQFQQLTYVLSQGGVAVGSPGTVTIGDAQSIEFVIPALAVGTYTITISGSDSNGDPCSGSQTFSISAGATTAAITTITCIAPTDASTNASVNTGNVAIDAGVVYTHLGGYQCPGISGLSAVPAEILSPQTAQLGVQTVVGATIDGGATGTPTIQWTTTGGSFDNANSANPVFNCAGFIGTAVTTVTIGLTGSNNGADAGDVCSGATNQTGSLNVVCDNGGAISCPGQQICPAVGTAPAYCATLSGGDSNNCGTCGTVCAAPTTCNAPGSCGCPIAGQTVCGTSCFATQTDATHCGSSCTACPSGDACVAGLCSAPPPKACVGTGDAANCVKCASNTSGICTATEALIVASDIANGKLNASGQLNSATACYSCLAINGGIDDSQGDHGNECGDVTGSATLTGETGTQACLDTLACIIAQSCDSANPPVSCLCGTALGTACLTAGAANGNCLQNELNGLDVTTGCPTGGCGTALGSLKEGDPTTLQEVFTSTTLGSGQANTIAGFAESNCTSQCGLNL